MSISDTYKMLINQGGGSDMFKKIKVANPVDCIALCIVKTIQSQLSCSDQPDLPKIIYKDELEHLRKHFNNILAKLVSDELNYAWFGEEIPNIPIKKEMFQGYFNVQTYNFQHIGSLCI